ADESNRRQFHREAAQEARTPARETETHPDGLWFWVQTDDDMKRLIVLVLLGCGARTPTKMNPDDASVADAPTTQPPIGFDASPPPPPPPPPMTNAVLVN